MNKPYIAPKLEVLPLAVLSALCSSVENSGIGSEGNGGSQGSSRAPRRTEVF